jgi:hypothetical protein
MTYWICSLRWKCPRIDFCVLYILTLEMTYCICSLRWKCPTELRNLFWDISTSNYKFSKSFLMLICTELRNLLRDISTSNYKFSKSFLMIHWNYSDDFELINWLVFNVQEAIFSGQEYSKQSEVFSNILHQ